MIEKTIYCTAQNIIQYKRTYRAPRHTKDWNYKKEKKKKETISSFGNRPRSIYQYSNMATRFSRQFGVPFFVSKSLLGIERQRN